MSDITTTRIFTDGERGITAAKLNDIVGSSAIQPAFYTAKPTAGTADPADIALILKAGAYAQVPISALAGSATQAQIWSTRLRSYNAIGNPNFEVDQRTISSPIGNPAHGSGLADRWQAYNNNLLNPYFQRSVILPFASVTVPGTQFTISSAYMRIMCQTIKASLAATDVVGIAQIIEGSTMRELMNDVHSISLLVRSSVANLTFGLSLRDSNSTHSLTKICTLGAANTTTLITLPNLPVWTPSGSFSVTSGAIGYILSIILAAGSTYMSPANDTWQNGNFMGATGQSNFLANPVNSTVDIFFVQHEPGPVCSTLMDKPFSQNLDECLRYYCKSYNYGIKQGTASNAPGAVQGMTVPSQHPYFYAPFPKRMAKLPTVNGWSPLTGTVNAVTNWTASVDWGVSGPSSVGESGFSGFTLASTPPAPSSNMQYHYTADTGW